VSGCCLLDEDWGDANEGSILSPPISHITLCYFPQCQYLRYWLLYRENAGWIYGGDGAKRIALFETLVGATGVWRSVSL
jgi:hypothetical protein